MRGRYEFPPERQTDLQRARRLEWVVTAFNVAIALIIYLAMGSSQAMKAAWVEDMLAFVPPIAFLVSLRFLDREPTEEYPYGFHRAVSIAFLAGAVALTIFGLYILVDSLVGLVRQERPTMGLAVVFGHEVWSGWIMLGALLISAIPPFVFGRLELPLANRLHDKTLKADAEMNRANWMTASAAMAGIVGVSLGWWWADAAAGALISLDIVRDGMTNLSRVVKDLVDRQPTTVHGRASGVPAKIEKAVGGLDWVERVAVRLREEGHVFTGEVFVLPADSRLGPERIREATETARQVDWKVHDLVVTLLPRERGGAQGS